MTYGYGHLQNDFQYEWVDGSPQRVFAIQLDHVLPAHDVYTTSKWIAFAEEFFTSVGSSLAREADSILDAFKQIAEQFDAESVARVYKTIHFSESALLPPYEIIAAAKYARQGMASEELCEMAASGAFESEVLSQRNAACETADYLHSTRTVDLIATYEELCSIPYEEQIVRYFGNYGIHVFKCHTTDDQIRPVYEKALATIEMDSSAFQSSDNVYCYRGEIIGRMRDCLLTKELKLGEPVLFVATMPYGGPGDFPLRGGVIERIDPKQKTCAIRGEFFTMEDIPLRYVLGRYNPEINEQHYGHKSVEPLLCEDPALAAHYLREVEEKCNAAMETAQIASPTM